MPLMGALLTFRPLNQAGPRRSNPQDAVVPGQNFLQNTPFVKSPAARKGWISLKPARYRFGGW
jgi:hypothetical protein